MAPLLVFGPSFWFLATPAAKSWWWAWIRTRRCARVKGLDQPHDSVAGLRSLQTGFSYLQSYPRKFLLCLLQRHCRYFRDYFFFFLRNIIFRSIIVDKHTTFVPDYATVLVKVVAVFSVINRVPATAHNIFCYSAIPHILTLSVNLAFRPKLGFKNKSRTWAGFGPGSGFKMRPFYNSVWVCMQGPTREDWKHTSSAHQQ